MEKENSNIENYTFDLNLNDIRYNYIWGSVVKIEISRKLVIRYVLNERWKPIENRKELFLNSIQPEAESLIINVNEVFPLLKRIVIEYPPVNIGNDLSLRMIRNIETENVPPHAIMFCCLAKISANKHFYAVKDHAESGPAEYHFHIEYKPNYRYKMRMSFDPTETTDATFDKDGHPLYWDKHNHGKRAYLNNETNKQKKIIHSSCLSMKGKMSVSAFAILSQGKKLYWKD